MGRTNFPFLNYFRSELNFDFLFSYPDPGLTYRTGGFLVLLIGDSSLSAVLANTTCKIQTQI